ncbi:MAG: HEAT repeat domain-containing protein [Firmicutes bacterium]|nr:HEAT repeat domain-containing protein [Bacillota bacterium]
MSLKEKVKELLDEGNFDKVAELAKNRKSVIRYLFSFLYATDDLLHWRAAEALGVVAAYQAKRSGNASNGPDGERNIPRRLVWSLAEESGATAWPATEALGAVVATNPNRFPDFGRIVLSFIDDPTLQRGVLWSARKIAEKRPDLVWSSVPKIIELLKDPNPTIRGHAAWVLGATKDADAAKHLNALRGDNAPLYIYDSGRLRSATVWELAEKSIAELEKIF